MVAQLMERAAGTAPKAKGVDTILTHILTGKELHVQVTSQVPEKNAGLRFFIRDAKNIAACDALRHQRGEEDGPLQGSTAGHCGDTCCEELTKNAIHERNGQRIFRAQLFGADD